MKTMKEINTDGLGNPTVPGSYNQPDIGLGTAALAGLGPDQRLIAQTAENTPNAIDPLNSGFSIGGANDPLAEDEFLGYDDIEENDINTFEDVDAIPTFEDIDDDPDLASLPVDASGVIDPEVIPDEMFLEPELGEIPDVILPFEEPILELGEDDDDVDIQIPENAFDNDNTPDSIIVEESFRLPENQSIIVTKGDQIFLLGRVREEFKPSFAETVFSRALKALWESKGGGHLVLTGSRHEKVAQVGRSLLVEVAKDWRLPGTDTIFEVRDLLQIVSAKPIREADETDSTLNNSVRKTDNAFKIKEASEMEKLKKKAILAHRRWQEAEKKRKEGDNEEDEDSEKDKAKQEAAFLERQRTGGWI